MGRPYIPMKKNLAHAEVCIGINENFHYLNLFYQSIMEMREKNDGDTGTDQSEEHIRLCIPNIPLRP